MAKQIVISVGHSLYVRGAKGYLDEVNEAVKFTNALKTKIEANSDVKVLTFFDKTSKTVANNLKTIVNAHNRFSRQLDVSIHFNAFKTTDKNMGTEVLHYSDSTKLIATNLSKAMSAALKLNNRGAKARTNLAFLKGTNKPAILLEVCFVDSSIDAEHYVTYFNDLVKATAKALVQSVKGVWKEVQSIENTHTTTIEKEAKFFIEKAIIVDGLLSDKTWIDKWNKLNGEQRANLLATILYRKFYK